MYGKDLCKDLDLLNVPEYLTDSFGLVLDHSKARISESADKKVRYTIIPGRLSVCDTVNGNRRKYPRAVWEKNLQDGSPLQQSISRNAAFGLLEHPKDGHVDLNSPIAVLTTQAILNEEDDTCFVDGEIRILDTVEGRRLCALIEAGYRPTVSSRGYGTLVKGPDGIDEVQDDYVCEGWDVVATPSFVQAELRPFESKESSSQKTAVVDEDAGKASEKTTDKVIVEKKESTSESSKAQETTTHTSTIMDPKQITESIARIKAIDPNSLGAIDFAQGMAHMRDLHNEVAAYVNEDRKRDWEGQTFHKAISALEESWATAVTAPREQVKKLQENQTKLLQVIKQFGATALNLRTKLSEALKQGDRRGKLTENVANRARSWMATAKKATADASSLEERYELACEALDLLAAQYKEDVAELGQRVLTLEFTDLTDAEKKAVTEAKTPQAVIRARKSITEARRKPDDKDKKINESKDKKDKKIDEDKDKSKDKKIDEDKDKGKNAPAPVEIVHSGREHSISESIGMTRRLSKYRAGN